MSQTFVSIGRIRVLCRSRSGASQKIYETLQRLSGQMGVLQHRTLELEKNTVLEWRMQSIEDDLSKLQVKFLGSSQLSEPDGVVTQLSQQVRELSENPLG